MRLRTNPIGVSLSLWFIVSPTTSPKGPSFALCPTGYSTPALDLYSTPPKMTSGASGNVLCSGIYRVARSIIFNVLENDQAGRSPPLCSRSDIAAHCYSSNWFASTPVDDNTAAFIAAVHAPTMEPRHFGSSPAWNLEPSTLLCTASLPPPTINYRISPKAGASPLRLPVASCSPVVTRAGLAQIRNFLGLAHYMCLAHYLVAKNSSAKPSSALIHHHSTLRYHGPGPQFMKMYRRRLCV